MILDIEYQYDITEQVYFIWPELEPYDHSIHFIFAGATPGRSFFERDPNQIIHEIHAMYDLGKRHFMFECLSEGYFYQLVKLIHDNILNQIVAKLPDAKFYYMTGSIEGAEFYEKQCIKHSWDRHLTVISCYYFEYVTRRYKLYGKDYVVGPRSKKFLCYNKVERHHRLTLFDKMLEADLVKDSYYSMQGSPGLLETVDAYAEVFPYVNNIKHLLPIGLNLDEDETRKLNPNDLRQTDHIHFEDSYLSVVTETVFYNMDNPEHYYIHSCGIDNAIFFSEKIYKPIAMKHPFILVSSPNALAALHERGYKTFPEFIDESYDKIEDAHERMDAIVNEIKRLCALPESELIRFTEYAKDIVEHNANHFQSLRDFKFTKDADKLL
jgi:hypothetical protein